MLLINFFTMLRFVSVSCSSASFITNGVLIMKYGAYHGRTYTNDYLDQAGSHSQDRTVALLGAMCYE